MVKVSAQPALDRVPIEILKPGDGFIDADGDMGIVLEPSPVNCTPKTETGGGHVVWTAVFVRCRKTMELYQYKLGAMVSRRTVTIISN